MSCNELLAGNVIPSNFFFFRILERNTKIYSFFFFLFWKFLPPHTNWVFHSYLRVNGVRSILEMILRFISFTLHTDWKSEAWFFLYADFFVEKSNEFGRLRYRYYSTDKLVRTWRKWRVYTSVKRKDGIRALWSRLSTNLWRGEPLYKIF